EQVLVDLPLVEAPAQLDRLVGPSGKGKDKKRETGQDCSHWTDLLETKSGGKASKRCAAFPGPRGGVTMVDVIIPVAGREARYHAACPGSRHVPVPPVAIVESDRAVPDAAPLPRCRPDSARCLSETGADWRRGGSPRGRADRRPAGARQRPGNGAGAG